MNERLGPSRLGEVLQPYLLTGLVLATASASGIALTFDLPRASMTIQIAFVGLLVPSLLLILPYVGSIAAQGLGSVSFPLTGVSAAAFGCAGFAAMIGLALSRPMEPVAGWSGLAVGSGLIAFQLLRRSRGPHNS